MAQVNEQLLRYVSDDLSLYHTDEVERGLVTGYLVLKGLLNATSKKGSLQDVKPNELDGVYEAFRSYDANSFTSEVVSQVLKDVADFSQDTKIWRLLPRIQSRLFVPGQTPKSFVRKAGISLERRVRENGEIARVSGRRLADYQAIEYAFKVR
ncbi:MAG: hypothetical protein ACMXYF_05115 [Candidatus Woesearchaeota archaeon]